jgi:hypothetical protein
MLDKRIIPCPERRSICRLPALADTALRTNPCFGFAYAASSAGGQRPAGHREICQRIGAPVAHLVATNGLRGGNPSVAPGARDGRIANDADLAFQPDLEDPIECGWRFDRQGNHYLRPASVVIRGAS